MKKLYIMLIAVLAISFFGSNDTKAAQKNAVIEDHTGAWCQYCPRGTYNAELLQDEKGHDRVIIVAVHNQDQMAIPTIQGTLAQAIGLTGYPSGSVNRKVFSQLGQTKPAMSDGAWTAASNLELAATSPVQVMVEYTIDKNSGDMTADLTALFDGAHSTQLAFNLFILEDKMVGSGNGWDQVNAFNNDPSSPFYQKGNPIKNFEHNNVLRDMVGGIWGVVGSLPATVKAGDQFTHKFTKNISSLVSNYDNVHVVAVVQEYYTGTSKMEILNATSKGKKALPAVKPTLATTDKVYESIDAGEKITRKVTVTNPSDFEAVFNVTLTNSLPTGWTATVSDSKFSLAAGASKVVDVAVSATQAIGMANVSVSVEAEASAEFKVLSTKLDLFALSSTAKKIVYSFSTTNNINILLSQNPANDIVAIAGGIDVLNTYKDQIDLLFLHEDNGTRGSWVSSGYAPLITLIDQMLSNGKKIIIGSSTGAYIAINQTQNSHSGATIFVSSLGMTSIGVQQLVNGNQLAFLDVAGINTNPIFAGFTGKVNGSYSQNYPIYNNFADVLNVVDGKKAEILCNYPAVTTGASVIGVTKGTGKLVYFGFSFDAFEVTKQVDFMNRIITWLGNEVVVEKKPELKVQDIFSWNDEVEIGSSASKALKISNAGLAEMKITSIEVTDDANGAFSIDQTSMQNTVAPESFFNLNLNFKANKVGEHAGMLRITTEDVPNGRDVELYADGKEVIGSVTIDNLLEMEITPNTFSTDANLAVNLKGSENVEIQLLDMTGSLISTINSGTLAGNNNFTISASNLANGQYLVVANIGGKVASLPIIVNK